MKIHKKFYDDMGRFYEKGDYYHVLENGPWIVLGHYLTVNRWRPNLRPTLEDIATTYIWARLLDSPIEFFNEELLIRVGKHLSKAIKVDPQKCQEAVSRACVEICLKKLLVPQVNIQGHTQTIEYEGLHQVCFESGKYDRKADTTS